MKSTRRQILAAGATLPALAQQNESYWKITADLVRREEETVRALMKLQTTDPASPWRGGYPDGFGLHHGGAASGLVAHFVTALVHKESAFHGSGELMDRLKLAIGFLNRKVSPEGNLDLLITNFNSPPDTAFATLNFGTAGILARKQGSREIEGLLEPVLKRSGAALARGGIHTPNHRWVVCAALAQVNHLYPDSTYVRRIEQWLGEGIDIDSDGQYTERSTVTYNGITNRALVLTAIRLKRPELLAPVRANLESMMYLLHPGDEVVTEISRRQDQYTRGTMAGYWLALRYLALKDGDGRYETLARRHTPGLYELMEHEELMTPGPEPAAVPDDYEKHFPFLKVARIRRGQTSATILEQGNSRFFSLRRGGAVIEAVRFASAFFGKGQFVPVSGGKRDGAYVLEQELTGPYYQPFEPGRKITTENFDETRHRRKQTEVCRMRYRASITEAAGGFDLRVQADGTNDVPLAIEIALRAGGELQGCQPAPEAGSEAFLLARGEAEYRQGGHRIRFGPGLGQHKYTQVRGAQAKLPGPSVYICGYTPTDHTVKFRW